MAGYDRDAIVHAFEALYATLMHMNNDPTTRLVTPPITWGPPFIQRTDLVVDLARHLPYGRQVHIAPGTQPINYYEPNWVGTWLPFEPFGRIEVGGQLEADIDENELVLTMQDENTGTILVLDTTSGNVRMITDTMSTPDCTRHQPYECPPLCRHSRRSVVKPAVELLQEWRNNFLSLKWMVGAMGQPDVVDDDPNDDEARLKRMRRLYRQYGWPDAYRAVECRDALADMPSSDDDDGDDDDDDDNGNDVNGVRDHEDHVQGPQQG